MSLPLGRTRRRALVASAVAGLAVFAVASPGSALAATTAQVQGTTLQITGNAASDKVALFADPATLFVDVGEDGTTDFSFERGTFAALDFAAGAGNDEIRLIGSLSDKDVTFDGGLGNDTLIGGQGSETLRGGPGNDFVDGNIGADAVSLGTGDDTVQWDPGDGSDTVEGDDGIDTLNFNGSNIGEDIDFSATGSHVRLFRNVAAITMDLHGIEGVNLRSIGGADTTTIGDLTGTDLKTVGVDLADSFGAGDGAADRVIVNATPAADRVAARTRGGRVVVSGLAPTVRVGGGEAANDQVVVDTLAGADTITSGVGLTGAAVLVDGGPDHDRARYLGGSGDDQIGIARDADDTVAAFENAGSAFEVTSSVESLEVVGGAGADTLAGQNGIGQITRLTLNGGAGDDTLRGGDGSDVLLGGDGNDLVDGNIGSDVARLGTGDDHFQWDPGDGSDTVEGDGGGDTLDFNGSNANERIDLSADGGRLRLLRDVAGIAMDVHGIEAVNVRTLGGTDSVFVDNLASSAVRNVGVDLSSGLGGGDALSDIVTVGGSSHADTVNVATDGGQTVISGLAATTRISGSETFDTLGINTFGGDDIVTVAPDVSQLITPIVNLGAGE